MFIIRVSTLLGLILFGLCGTSVAATVSGTVDIQFTSGPLAGNDYDGTFDFDDTGLSGIGTEFALPDGAASDDRDLTLSILVDGLTVTELDDEDFPEAPELELLNGLPQNFDYFTNDIGGRALILNTDGSAAFNDQSAGSSLGTYTLALTVPEPTAIALGLIGVILLNYPDWRRRRSAIQ